jgi:hypothetical protein
MVSTMLAQMGVMPDFASAVAAPVAERLSRDPPHDDPVTCPI